MLLHQNGELMYILYIALFGVSLSLLHNTNGFYNHRLPKNKQQYTTPLQMRSTKRTKSISDTEAINNIVASLAAGGGGSGNCRALSPVYTPRTPNQKTYVQYLGEPDTKIVLGVGSAGSGKTLFACYSAIQELQKGTISKIIMTRPVVPVEEEEIGFLPGSLINKMDPWTRPIFDILLEFYSQKDIDAMLHKNVIEISPLAYMRGRTFKRAFIIADEMQNSSPNQMLMLTTRLGDGSKMVITGDLQQSDRGDKNGLVDLLRKIKAYNQATTQASSNTTATATSTNTSIKYVELEPHDVQRSAIVQKILDIYGGVTPVPPAPAPARDIPSNDDAAIIPIQHMSKYMKSHIKNNKN